MRSGRVTVFAALGFFIALALPVGAQSDYSGSRITLNVFAAGTLAAPFNRIAEEFMKLHPEVRVQAQYGGSVKMVKQVTELGQVADVVAVADYRVIPKYMFVGKGEMPWAFWYAGFATNAITFVYTPQSKFALEINKDNWYDVLSRKGVEIGRSNPDTDPSGYQTVQMLGLASKFYHRPGLADSILANAPKSNMRDTETELVAALESGQIDYLAIYLSDARQHHFNYLDLPPEVNLSDARFSDSYAKSSVKTANGPVSGVPIVYAITVPTNSNHPDWAARFVAFVLGKEGMEAMSASGFGGVSPAYGANSDKMPAYIQPLVIPWPKK